MVRSPRNQVFFALFAFTLLRHDAFFVAIFGHLNAYKELRSLIVCVPRLDRTSWPLNCVYQSNALAQT